MVKWRTEKIIYKCTSLTESNFKKVYLRLAQRKFRENWYYNHQQLLRNQNYSKSITLSTNLWNIKTTCNKNLKVKSEILQKKSSLFKHEKLAISSYLEPDEFLNKRIEMIYKCHHHNKFLLKNINSNNRVLQYKQFPNDLFDYL